MNTELPEIVRRALVETVTDIGQLSKSEIYQLNKYVKKGWLSRGKGGSFPILKTVYAHRDFDFAASRERYVEAVMAAYEIEKRLRASGYFDVTSPNYGVDLNKQQRKDDEQMNTDLFCRYPNHEDQRLNFPVGTIIETVSLVAHLGTAIPVGARGRITSHCDDGRAWIVFDNYSDAGHTFHAPERFIRVVELPGSEPSTPRAGEQEHEWYYIKWYEIDLKAYPQEPKFAVEQSETLLAVVLEEETAAKIIADHNQHATLIEQRERLAEIISMTICHGCHNRIGWNETPTKYGDWTKCSSCRAARELLATIEREGEA